MKRKISNGRRCGGSAADMCWIIPMGMTMSRRVCLPVGLICGRDNFINETLVVGM